MKNIDKIRILVDLSTAADGYSGIAQDSRLTFSMLSSCDNLSVSGLMYPLGRPAMPRIVSNAADMPSRAAGVINAVSLGWHNRPRGGRAHRLFTFSKEIKDAAQGRHRTYKIPDWLKTDALWRLMFQKTLPPAEREFILKNDFFVTNLSVGQISDRSIFMPFLRSKRLDAREHDAVLFPLPRPIRLPPGVQKIVRYHDAIPMTHSDTVVHWMDIAWHHRFTNSCAKDGFFVCNSPMSVNDLDNVAPGAGDFAVVIPCAIQNSQPLRHSLDVQDILSRRMSLLALGISNGTPADISCRQQIEQKLRRASSLRFVISVSTIEPRKNFATAIAAWERVRAITKQDIKFIMVASHGWKMDETLEAMRPHVLAGNLIHLHKLPFSELQALYQQAEVCLFPSYAEGFGFAPLEALRLGTPVVASDIPVFRWTLDDAALYADPYNATDVAESTMRVLRSSDNEMTRRTLLAAADKVLARFSVTSVCQQWKTYFTDTRRRLYEKSTKFRKT